MAEDTDPERLQRPEGALLRSAMNLDRRSARKLAAAIGLSDSRLRQIVNGYMPVSGQLIPVIAPARTLARIATELAVAPEDLREVGRGDAADLMAGTGAHVGGDTEHDDADDALLFRRPEGLTDAQWGDLKERERDHWEWELNRAAKER